MIAVEELNKVQTTEDFVKAYAEALLANKNAISQKERNFFSNRMKKFAQDAVKKGIPAGDIETMQMIGEEMGRIKKEMKPVQ